MWPLARYSGHPAFVRKSRFHALSQRAAARRAARELKIPYEKINLIVVHMGGGTPLAHRRGRVVDVNDGLDGEGPCRRNAAAHCPPACWQTSASPANLAQPDQTDARWPGRALCLSRHRRLPPDRGAHPPRRRQRPQLYEAMAYQIAKWVGASAAVLSGRVSAVVVTGGIPESRLLVRLIRKYAGFVAPFLVYPEMEEMWALAASVQAAAAGKIKIQEYR